MAISVPRRLRLNESLNIVSVVRGKDQLNQEVHTGLLWSFEGITSYYEELCLVRSGCIEERSYLELVAQNITRVMRTPGRNVQNLVESSFDAWTELYKPDENAPNAIIRYYAKGPLVALALDLILRQRTDGERSLDDIMRALWLRYGKTGLGVPEEGVEAVVAEVSGIHLGSFLTRRYAGRKTLISLRCSHRFGSRCVCAPVSTARSRGVSWTVSNRPPAHKTFGVRLDDTQSDAIVANAFTGGPGMQAGISGGDRIVAIDGIRANRVNFDTLVDNIPDGEAVSVHLFRRDELMEVEVTPHAAPRDTCELRILDEAPDTVRRRRLAWLGQAAGA